MSDRTERLEEILASKATALVNARSGQVKDAVEGLQAHLRTMNAAGEAISQLADNELAELETDLPKLHQVDERRVLVDEKLTAARERAK